MSVHGIVGWTATAIEIVGVSVIVLGLVIATIACGIDLARRKDEIYRHYRRRMGRGILLGIEFLVAADIIRTVTETVTFESLGLLALVIVLRTFLSMALETEITGRFPWRGAAADL